MFKVRVDLLKFLIFVLVFSLIFISSCGPVKAQTQTLNPQNKDKLSDQALTNLVGKCGQNYFLVTPQKSDIWKINVTIVSELSTQNVFIYIAEVGANPTDWAQYWATHPRASGIGKAQLVTYLNTSQDYELIIRDAYAKQFTGSVEETWRPYVLNGDFEEGGYPIPGWTAGGQIGHGSGETTLNKTKVVGLQQYSYGSNIWQEVYLDRKDLVYSFWYRPYPEGTIIGFKALFDGIPLLTESFQDKDSDYNWKHVILFLEPFLIQNGLSTGNHKIEFLVTPSSLPHAAVEIDEVKIYGMKEEYKVKTNISARLNKTHTLAGNAIRINGILQESTITLLNRETHQIQIRYSRDEGRSWWFFPTVYTTSNSSYRIDWVPNYPGSYLFEISFLGDNYYYPSKTLTGPLIVGSFVEIDESLISDDRCDVGSTQTVRIHTRYLHDHSNAVGIGIMVGGNSYITDANGWINFTVSNDKTVKTNWDIVAVTNVDGYKVLIDPPSIIWDKVILSIDPVQRIDTGKAIVKWVGRYAYNNETFGGNLVLNDTLSKNLVGAYGYKVMAINDPKYGITIFSANDFKVIYDRVDLTLSVSKSRIDAGIDPKISITGKYEYDSKTFVGQVQLTSPTTKDVGSFKYTVQSITDPLYKLTSFKSNEVVCVWDRVKIIQGGVSKPTAKTGDMESVWFKAVYEYDNEELTGDKGTIFVNNLPMIWSSFDKAWKYSTKLDDNGKLVFEVSKVEDKQYGLTKFLDVAGPQSITWEKPFLETPLGIASIASVLAVIAAGAMFALRKRI